MTKDEEFTVENALEIVYSLIQNNEEKSVSDIEKNIFIGAWQGLTYIQMENQYNYKQETIKKYGSCLWKKLTNILGYEINKKTLRLL